MIWWGQQSRCIISGRTDTVSNPANPENPNSESPVVSGAQAASAAIVAADAAFRTARTHTREERAAWLDAIADALEARRAEIVPLGVAESNLPAGRLEGELTRTCFQLKLLAQEAREGQFLDATIDHADSTWGMGPRPDLRRINVPLGVIGVFGASNFPLAFSVIGGDSAAALAGGNAVVHKVHDAHMGLGTLVVETVTAALAAAGAPAGLFAGVSGLEAAQTLVDHPLTKAIGFTGSEAGGRALFDRAVARPTPIPFYGELGSLNPVVITEAAWDARATELLSGFAGSLTNGVGQFCTNPGMVFLPAAAATQANAELPALLAAQDMGAGMLTEGIAHNFTVHRDEVAAAPGVTTEVAGDNANPPAPAILTIAAADLSADHPALHTEMFGPAAVIITYANREELIETIGLLGGQLTGTLHNEDGEDVADVLTALADKAGRVLRGGWPTGVTVSYAQQHGGPYPAATMYGTSVGTAAIGRFMRPVAFQDYEDAQLPAELQEANPTGIARRVDGVWQAAR
nr:MULTISPECIES: aldehyde dehydrogenase (NADP(+)) [unclassified Brevibacterium]